MLRYEDATMNKLLPWKLNGSSEGKEYYHFNSDFVVILRLLLVDTRMRTSKLPHAQGNSPRMGDEMNVLGEK